MDSLNLRQRILLNQPHTESATGDIASFTTNMKAPLKKCKIYFEPVQEGEGDPSPENVREIKGWDETNIYLSNEITLFNSFGATSGRSSGINNDKRVTTNSYGTTINRTDTDGIKTELVVTQSIADSTKKRYKNGYISLFPNTDKLIIGNSYYFDADIEIISNPLDKLPEMMLTDDANNKWTITIDDGKLHEAFVWKERPTVYQYPFIEFYCNGCSFKLKNMVIIPSREVKTINWTDQTGTVYGGYVDLAKGELVEEWIKKPINSFTWTYASTGICFRTVTNIKNKSYGVISPVLSNIYKTINVGNTMTRWADYDDFSISEHTGVDNSGNRKDAIHIKDLRYTTVSDFLNGVGNESIIYELVEPIHYQLTPQQLLTLKGTNNIWSNSNGQTEVKFWTY